MDLTTIIGVIGASIVLIAFVLNQFGKLSTESKTYDFLNMIGPAFLVVYSHLLESYPFLVLNVVWATASAMSLFKDREIAEFEVINE